MRTTDTPIAHNSINMLNSPRTLPSWNWKWISYITQIHSQQWRRYRKPKTKSTPEKIMHFLQTRKTPWLAKTSTPLNPPRICLKENWILPLQDTCDRHALQHLPNYNGASQQLSHWIAQAESPSTIKNIRFKGVAFLRLIRRAKMLAKLRVPTTTSFRD